MADPDNEAFQPMLELARASGLEISPEMFSVVLELLRLDVTPQGVVALLRQLKDAKLRGAARDAISASAAAQ
jgi:hypothetical protein